MTNVYAGITMTNIKRERFNLSFSVDLLRTLRQMAHERTMSGKSTGINELIEDAVSYWLASKEKTERVPKSEHDIPRTALSNVIDYTEYDPVFTTLGRLLRSDQAAHVRAFLQFADEHITTHNPDSLSSEDRADEAIRLSETLHRDASPEVLADTTRDEEDEPAIQRGNKKPHPKDRKRAS